MASLKAFGEQTHGACCPVAEEPRVAVRFTAGLAVTCSPQAPCGTGATPSLPFPARPGPCGPLSLVLRERQSVVQPSLLALRKLALDAAMGGPYREECQPKGRRKPLKGLKGGTGGNTP